MVEPSPATHSRNSCPAVYSTIFPPTQTLSCDYCCVTFVSIFINLGHPRDFTSHKSRRGTLYIYIGWVSVGWQRHCQTCRLQRERDNQGTYHCLFLGGRRNWRPNFVHHLCGVENLHSAQGELSDQRSVYGKAPTRQLHRNPVAVCGSARNRKTNK